jgi:sugar phosphate isomerase/epimerase
MQLKIFKTLWGHQGDLAAAITQATTADFQGIEGPAPADKRSAAEYRQRLTDSGLDYLAEVCTAGSYVPERLASLQQHLDSFAEKLDHSLLLEPLFVSCLGGCDAWSEAQSIEFFGRALELATAAGVEVSFETHRSRSLFNPWVTERILQALPEMQITCDFSHWCVVCERLMDAEMATIEAIAPRARHIHARVGYDQGPQVPHPGAPEYAEALRSHQRCWEVLWRAQRARGLPASTLTPEFGPDGYLQAAPFTREPVADLWELNRWMANAEREHFNRWQS